MSKFIKSALSLVLAMTVITSACPAYAAPGGGTGPELYDNRRELDDGFYYTNTVSMNDSGKRVETYSLETTAGSPVYPIVLAKDYLQNAMDIDEMTAWAESHGYNVHGAINADFFYGENGYPLGGVIEDGEYISDLDVENLLAFSDEGAFYCVKPRVEISLYNMGGGYDPATGFMSSNAGRSMKVQYLNRVRTNVGGLFLYTDAFHSESTCTSRAGWGVRFRVLSGEMTVSGQVELEVVDVIPSGTDYEIGEGYMVLSAPADNKNYASAYENFTVGDRVSLTTVCSDERLIGAEWAVGCGDILAENGALTDKETWDKDLVKVHPRTGVGIKPDGSVIAYVVDGRQGAYSNGALLEEMAADLLARGCVSVVNLDGGGSSVMSVRIPGEDSCAIVNRPSSGKPRKCGDYILFVSDMVPDGIPRRLHLEEDGAYVLTGSSIPVNVVATDNAGMPADFTDGVFADSVLGTMGEGFYTAGDTAGVDTIWLSAYSSNASGQGSIHVIDTLDTLMVLDAETGKSPDLAELESGDEVQLMLTGTRLTRDVAVDMTSASVTITEGLGEMTEDGIFTLTAAPGTTGEIAVTAGGITVTLKVGAKLRFTDTVGHWAQAYIDELYDKGVVTGTGGTIFNPDGTICRSDFILMLWRALGSPAQEAPAEGETAPPSPFIDVATDAYYYDSVVWAAQIGLSNGTGDGRFDPTGKLTREQAFTLVYRLLTLLRKELPEPDPIALEVFADTADIHDFAFDAMASLTSYGMIAGSGGKCSPLNETTRGEMAKILVTALY